jgi:hypothetical protein
VGIRTKLRPLERAAFFKGYAEKAQEPVPIGNLIRLVSCCESGDAVVRCGTFAD